MKTIVPKKAKTSKRKYARRNEVDYDSSEED